MGIFLKFKRCFDEQLWFCGWSEKFDVCVHYITLEVWRQVSQFDCVLWLWFLYFKPFPDVIRWPLEWVLWEVSVPAHPTIKHGDSLNVDLCGTRWLSRSGHCNKQSNRKQQTFHHYNSSSNPKFRVACVRSLWKCRCTSNWLNTLHPDSRQVNAKITKNFTSNIWASVSCVCEFYHIYRPNARQISTLSTKFSELVITPYYIRVYVQRGWPREPKSLRGKGLRRKIQSSNCAKILADSTKLHPHTMTAIM